MIVAKLNRRKGMNLLRTRYLSISQHLLIKYVHPNKSIIVPQRRYAQKGKCRFPIRKGRIQGIMISDMMLMMNMVILSRVISGDSGMQR